MPQTNYKPEYCQQIIKFMETGKSKEAFAGSIGVSRQAIYNWMKAQDDFKEACGIAEARCQNFWEELGLVGVTEGKNFNATAWIYNMKCRFPDQWREKQEISGLNGGPIGVVVLPTLKDDPNNHLATPPGATD